jgi:antitoxin PrlF
MKSTVSEKGQMTIPRALRESLGLTPGSLIELEEELGTIILRPASGQSLAELSGSHTFREARAVYGAEPNIVAFPKRGRTGVIMEAVVSDKGQVTIPKVLRDRLDIGPGQVLDFEAEAGKLVLRKRAQGNGLRNLLGLFPELEPADSLLDVLRGPVDLP